MINPFDLETLIAPVSLKAFFEEYWEKNPLILNKEREGYQNLLSLKEFEFLLFSVIPATRGAMPWVRFTNNKSQMDISSRLNKSGAFIPKKVMEAFRQGDTIELVHPEERYEPLKRFCSGIERLIGHKAYTTAFLTPPYSQGFGEHFDPYEIFILQIEGKKRWRLYDANIIMPIDTRETPFNINLPKPLYEIDLKKGDFLYIPSGLVHEAFTTDDLSLHISVVVDTTRWIDLIREVVANEVDFRKALPIGVLNEATAEKIPMEYFEKIKYLFSDRNKIEEAFRILKSQYSKEKSTPNNLSFECKEQEREISPETVFKKREGVVCTLISKSNETIIHFGHEEISAPSHIEPSLEYIIDADRFSIRSMPDSLTESGKMTLVKTLLREGLLEIEEAD